MNRLAVIVGNIGPLILLFPAVLLAESRGKPFTEEQLLEQSSAVFVGEVIEIATFDGYKRIVPKRVRVLVSIKGQVSADERAVVPKDPGLFVYFDEEFSQAMIGHLGVFYVGAKGQPDLLIGYKQLPGRQLRR